MALKEDLDLIRDAIANANNQQWPVDADAALAAFLRVEQLVLSNDYKQRRIEFSKACEARLDSAPSVSSVEIAPPLAGFECGRCLVLQHQATSDIPEHSPRCPMREERAKAWDDGLFEGIYAERDNVMPKQNPHR